MISLPQPASPSSAYSATYDAWNRLVAVSSGGTNLATYQYDGLKWRLLKNLYVAGVLSEARHCYFSSVWQVIEERVGVSTNAERQFVWGQGYIDDLILRDRDASGTGTLVERFYAMHDSNWNVTGLVDLGATVEERYSFSAYGVVTFLNSSFATRSESGYAWETLLCGYRWDSDTGLYHVRHRVYHPVLGSWTMRDLIGYSGSMSLYNYVRENPVSLTDPLGLWWWLLGQNAVVPRPFIEPVAPTFPRLYVPPTAPPAPPLAPPVPPPVVGPPANVEPAPVGPNPAHFPRNFPADNPLTRWRCPPTRSDCDRRTLDRWNRTVNRLCKEPPPEMCIGWRAVNFWSCDRLRKAAEEWEWCARARRMRENRCFRGGDWFHRYAIGMANYHAATCWYRMRVDGCFHDPIDLRPPVV